MSVAAANKPAMSAARRAWDPLPDTAPISENVVSTAVTVSAGSDAADGRVRSDAQPTPIWRCGSSPESHDTMIAVSFGSGAARRSSSAMWATLVSRDEVPPTLSDVLATSRRSTIQLGMAPRQGLRQGRGADALAYLGNVTNIEGF